MNIRHRSLALSTYFIVIIYLYCGVTLAQEKPKLCNEDISKKALAFYEKGIDRKKYKKPERVEFLKKALEIEPDFAEANVAVGLEYIAHARLDGLPFTPALAWFNRALAVCPDVHSDPLYYIAFDYYERQLKSNDPKLLDSSIRYLRKFLDFKSDDESKFGKDWNEETREAKMMLRSAEKQKSLRRNVMFDPKVVRGVSSERDEYLAYVSPDDRSCYFVRRLPVKSMNRVFEKDTEKEVFMISKRDKTGVFDSGKPMDSPFNQTDDNQGGCSISIDNKHLYFSMMRFEGGDQPNCDLYVSDFTDGDWGEIRKLSANVNHPKFWDSQPTISADGLTLYFASDRPGGYGGIDIWCTRKDPKTGVWGVPENLGPMINTAGDEKTPFIHSDSETLYFSSTGHTGFGRYDIFYSRKTEKGDWEEAANIGSPINDLSDDTGFFVSSDAKTGYFVSFDEGKMRGKGIGGYDLYSFELYNEARPQQIVFVKGVVKDSAGNNVQGAIVEVRDTKTKQLSYATVDSTSGEYMLALKKKNDVLVTVKKDDVAFNSRLITMKEVATASTEPKEMNLEVRETRKGSSFVINNILYQTSSAELTTDSRVILEDFANYLNENPTLRIEIQGHTDNVGNPKDNQALSSNRAISVKKVLEEFKVDEKRITAKGFGASRPVASNSSEEGRKKNRRTEFLILEK
jgi:outer membrane protein OmpA-like peptidoglycan-associated protein/tetratricopeptide (TPR) repeat protein